MANEYILKQDAFDAVEARIAELMTHPEFRRKHLDIDLSGVIRNISAIKPADVLHYTIDPDGTLTITVPKGTYKNINRVLVEEDGTQWEGCFMRISICGIPHEVVECEDVFDTEMHLGMIDYKQAKILINKDANIEIKSETLCHEIMHGILVHIGREDLSQDETFVTALGNAIWQTFNVRYLDEG